MHAIRTGLAAVCIFVLGTVALALTPGQRTVLSRITPIASANFQQLTSQNLPTWLCGTSTATCGPNLTIRTGNATQIDSSGKMIWGPVNEYINSANATNTARTVTSVAGVNYYLWCQTSSGTATIVATGTASYTLTCTTGGSSQTFTATAGTLTLTPTTNYANITSVILGRYTYENSFPRTQDAVTTGASAYYGARLDWNPTTLLARGLLIEKQATNYAYPTFGLASQNKTAAGTGSAPTATDNYAIAPDGTTTATRVQFALNGGTALGDQSVFRIGSFTVTNGNPYAGGLYVTSNTGSTYTMIYTLGSVEKSVTVAPGVWTRLFQSQNASGTAMSIQIYLRGARTPTNSDSADISVWGPQLEDGTFQTSQIYANSASVTRSSDVAQLTGAPLSVANSGQGTVIGQTSLLEDSGTVANQIVLGDSNTNYRYFGLASGTSNQVSDYNGTNSLTATMGSGTWTGGSVRFVSAWSSSGRSLAANGGAVVTTTSTFPGIDVDGVFVGARAAGSQVLNGWLASLTFFRQRLSDGALPARSIVDSSLAGDPDEFPHYAANDNLPVWRKAM